MKSKQIIKEEKLINGITSKYLKGFGLSGSQVDYLKTVLHLMYTHGYRDATKDSYSDAIERIKKNF